ncbi:MAG: DUF5763 domain-containing protein [Pseudobacter sp.]|uniref:DUF5763 domain-containing protein n=1 Tax=Pseudobacter sp. TaxID=2045420 RepID=UPI003F7CF0ED
MKSSIMLLLALSALLTALAFAPRCKSPKAELPAEKEYATCYGRTPCTACSNCSGCKHCNAGGTCGVCEKKKPVAGSYGSSNKKKTSESGSIQCRAITKKGTRCSRNQKSGGYCWQHGG